MRRHLVFRRPATVMLLSLLYSMYDKELCIMEDSQRIELNRMIRVARGDAQPVQGALVVLDFEVGELQTVGGRKHHGALTTLDSAAGCELFEDGQRHPGVWVVEHPGQVSPRGRLR